MSQRQASNSVTTRDLLTSRDRLFSERVGFRHVRLMFSRPWHDGGSYLDVPLALAVRGVINSPSIGSWIDSVGSAPDYVSEGSGLCRQLALRNLNSPGYPPRPPFAHRYGSS